MRKISARAYAGVKDVLLTISVALTLLTGPAPATADEQRVDPYLLPSEILVTTASNLTLGTPMVIAHDGKLDLELKYHTPTPASTSVELYFEGAITPATVEQHDARETTTRVSLAARRQL